uniref:Protein E7 n=1 Tax=Mops bat papillomavirus TaxID=3141892 RepID=A0AAU7E331_9PAPI
MIGKAPTLRDIVLQEQPEPVSLICHERLDEEEPIARPYKITLCCCYCPRMLRIAVRSTPGGILTLEDLLLRHIEFACTRCAKEQRSYG